MAYRGPVAHRCRSQAGRTSGTSQASCARPWSGSRPADANTASWHAPWPHVSRSLADSDWHSAGLAAAGTVAAS